MINFSSYTIEERIILSKFTRIGDRLRHDDRRV